MDGKVPGLDVRRLAPPLFLFPLFSLTAYFALMDPYSQVIIQGVPGGFINGTFERSTAMLDVFAMVSLYQRGLKRTILTVAVFYGVSSVVFEAVYFAHLGVFWYTVIFANIGLDPHTLPGWAFKQVYGLVLIAILFGARRFNLNRKSLYVSVAYFGQFLIWLFVFGFPWAWYVKGEAGLPQLFVPQFMETLNVALSLLWFYVVVQL